MGGTETVAVDSISDSVIYEQQTVETVRKNAQYLITMKHTHIAKLRDRYEQTTQELIAQAGSQPLDIWELVQLDWRRSGDSAAIIPVLESIVEAMKLGLEIRCCSDELWQAIPILKPILEKSAGILSTVDVEKLAELLGESPGFFYEGHSASAYAKRDVW